MKKFFYLIALCAGIVGCSQNEEIQVRKNAQSKVLKEGSANEHYDNIDVYEYISENKDLFGTPLVFNSLDEADDLLDSLQSMNSMELCERMKNKKFHNSIVESNYRYLSIYEKKQSEFAPITYFASETDRLTALINAVADEMEKNYPTLCIISEYTTADNSIVKSVNPLGDFDIYALCNEKGIVVIDKVVYWFVENNLISCPIDKFSAVANQLNVYDMTEISSICENDDYVIASNVMCDVQSLQRAQVVDDHFRYYEASNGDYKLTIYMTAYPYWAWGSTNYRSKVTITNLYKGSEYKATDSGNFYYFALGQYGDLRINLYFYDYKSQDIKDEFKSKTYRQNVLVDQYTKTKETFVDIQRVYVNITQDTGSWDGLNKRVVSIKVNE